MTGRVRYTREDMDRLIGATVKHRSRLTQDGLIDRVGNYKAPTTAAEAPGPVTHKGYCMKCKTKVDAVTESVEDTKNGAKRAVGKCQTCGTGVHAYHSAADGQKLADALESNRALTGGVR